MSNTIQLSASITMNQLSLHNNTSASTTTSRLSTGKKVNASMDSPVNYLADLSNTSRGRELSFSKEGMQKISEIRDVLENASAATQEQKAAQSPVTDSSLAAIHKLSQTSQGSSRKLLDGAVSFNLDHLKVLIHWYSKATKHRLLN